MSGDFRWEKTTENHICNF
jgi:hypothetical protein